MATLPELKAALAKYDEAASDTDGKREQRDTDRAAADTAVSKADVSYNAWRQALVRQHELDDEFDTLSAAHEPPDLPSV